MYGLLGTSLKSRFVFLAIPDHGEPPELKDLKRLLNCSEVNLYKADGYYKDSFSEVEWLLHFQKRGISHEDSWCIGERFFSHVVKLGPRCEWNSMAELRYSQQIVIRLELDEQRLRSLGRLLQGIRKLRSQLAHGVKAQGAVVRAIDDLKKVDLLRNVNLIPSQADIDAIFELFGEFERQQYDLEIESWIALARFELSLPITQVPMHSSLGLA